MKEEIVVEEKMKKKFRKLKKIMVFLEGLLLFVPLMVFIIIIVSGILVGFSGKEDKLNVFNSEVKEGLETFDLKEMLVESFDLREDLEDDEDYINGTDTIKNLMIASLIIVRVVAYVLAIIIVDKLATIFGEVENKGTPFTENNIKWLKTVNIVALNMWLLHTEMISVGLLFVIVISAFRTVFEYGYKLQKESDETL